MKKKRPAKKKAVRLVRNGGTSVQPESEISATATRRTFTAEYKRDILQQAAACTEPGSIGALLRREGLYSSHLTTWRQAQERGELAGLRGHRRGPKGRKKMVSALEAERLEREVNRLKTELRKAQTIIGVQKKLSEMLGIEMKPDGSSE